MYNKLLGRGLLTIYVRKNFKQDSLTYFPFVIPRNFLIFCKKLFSQTNNEKVDVSTHKKNFLWGKSELIRANAFKIVYLQKKDIFLNALKCALFICKSIDFSVTCVPE